MPCPVCSVWNSTWPGRYENYSDFGSTSHPKIGLNWSPVDGVMVHASYGTSFRAPLLSELVGPLKGVFVQTYSDPISPTGTSVGYTLGGGNLRIEARNGDHLLLRRGLSARQRSAFKFRITSTSTIRIRFQAT